MWKNYHVELRMEGKFAAALPKTAVEIKLMLANRMPAHPPLNFIPIDELVSEVEEKVAVAEEEREYGWATFPRNEDGLYYEGRCIRGHLKDLAGQVKDILGTKTLKSKVANKVYVVEDIIPLGVKEVAGTEVRFIQVMTRLGPRSTIKNIDYLERPTLVFTLKVLDDGIITREIIEALLDYGSVHGLGAERSQGWGRYSYTLTE